MSTSQNKAQLEQTIDQQKQRMLELMSERDEARNALEATQEERDDAVRLLGFHHGVPEPKPTRLRILELPAEIDTLTQVPLRPFVLVFDRVPPDREIKPELLAVEMPNSRGVIVFEHELQLGDDSEGWAPREHEFPPNPRQSAGQPLPAELYPVED